MALGVVRCSMCPEQFDLGHPCTQRLELALLPVALVCAALTAACCVLWRRKPSARTVRLPSGAAVSIRN